MERHITDYSEERVNERISLQNPAFYAAGYYRRERDGDGLIEIGYRKKIKPIHYSWMLLGFPAIPIVAFFQAVHDPITHFFDVSNGEYLGQNQREAQQIVNSRREERRLSEETASQIRWDAEQAENLAAVNNAQLLEAERESLLTAAEESAQREEILKRNNFELEAKIAELKEADRQRTETAQARAEQARRADLLSQGNTYLLESNYQEAFTCFEDLCSGGPHSSEVTCKRDIAHNILSGNTSSDEGDEAANSIGLRRNYQLALRKYRKALGHFRSAQQGFQQLVNLDSRFRCKVTQAQENIRELQDKIADVERKANGEEIHIDIVSDTVEDINLEAEHTAEPQTQTYLARDRN